MNTSIYWVLNKKNGSFDQVQRVSFYLGLHLHQTFWQAIPEASMQVSMKTCENMNRLLVYFAWRTEEINAASVRHAKQPLFANVIFEKSAFVPINLHRYITKHRLCGASNAVFRKASLFRHLRSVHTDWPDLFLSANCKVWNKINFKAGKTSPVSRCIC